MIFQYLQREEKKVVVTPLMERTVRRTMAVHAGGALVVWTGPSRNGKTWTAEWMVNQMEDAYHTSSDAFHACHFEIGEIDSGSAKGDQKQAIRTVYHAAVGRLDEGVYRSSPVSDLARLTVHGLETKNVQMVFVDEAGLASHSAIRGFVLLRDTAEIEGWPLSIVLIGMDDLPTKLKHTEQVWNRIHEWCYFKPYDVDDTYRFLAELHPHFATLDLAVPSHREQVQFIHDTYRGLPGLFAPFLRRLRALAAEVDREIDLLFLKAVHLRTQRDQDQSLSDAATRGLAAPPGPSRQRRKARNAGGEHQPRPDATTRKE